MIDAFQKVGRPVGRSFKSAFLLHETNVHEMSGNCNFRVHAQGAIYVAAKSH